MIALEGTDRIHNKLHTGMLITTGLKPFTITHSQSRFFRSIDSTGCSEQGLRQDVDGVMSIEFVIENNEFSNKIAYFFNILDSLFILDVPVFMQLK